MMDAQQIRQCYYTHWKNEEMGINGWRTKAQSPGLSEGHIKMALPYFHYTFADLRSDVSTHPVALRYVPINARESVLISIHSIGKTEDARDGNKFVHALFLPPTAFQACAPIFYWDSPFWKKRDEERVPYELDILPELTATTVKPGLSEADIWQFLDQCDPEREKLYQLVCAVIHKERTHRPVVILEQPAQVARWIAAISLLLPPQHYRLLSFSTYNNQALARNNLESNLFIIGLANLPERSILARDYQTYMIFDPAGQTSSVEDSDYARQAISFASYKEYARIGAFFAKVMAGRGLPTYVGEALETQLKYENILSHTGQHPSDRSILRGRLEQFEASSMLSTSTQEQKQLEQLRNYYWSLDGSGQFAEYTDDLWRVLKLYTRFARPSRTILGSLLQQALLQGSDQVSRTMKRAFDLYEPQELSYVFSNLCVIDQQALPMFASVSASMFADYWRRFARQLNPHEEMGAFLEVSLRISYLEADHTERPELFSFRRTVLAIMRGRELAWLQLALQQDRLTQKLIHAFYFDLIDLLPYHDLEQRTLYRALLNKFHSPHGESVFATIWQDEIDNDINVAIGKPNMMCDSLEAWMVYASKQKNQAMINFILEETKNIIDDERTFKLRNFKQKVLESPYLAAAILSTAQVEAERKPLVQKITSIFTPSGKLSLDEQSAEGEATELENQFEHALVQNQLNSDLCQSMQRTLSVSERPLYQRKVTSYIEMQLKLSPIQAGQHTLLLLAIFVSRYQDLFWEEYMKHLRTLFLIPERSSDIRAILNFWYNNANPEPELEYVRVEFYGEFPFFINTIKYNKKFKDVLEQLYPLIKDEPWYTHSVFQDNFNPAARKLSPFGKFFSMQ